MKTGLSIETLVSALRKAERKSQGSGRSGAIKLRGKNYWKPSKSLRAYRLQADRFAAAILRRTADGETALKLERERWEKVPFNKMMPR